MSKAVWSCHSADPCAPLPAQSSEDIEALVVDEDMPELDRFALLFERGRVVQRLSVVNSLPGLVADHGECRTLLLHG